ncbi:single-stranded DNA-binding protein [Chryseobacterium joostei]|uniref:Single-stranded DNA-binding protein n=1 Tax=Chryseobacterium joostei TaxID=112234 RepID=A0A1N7HTZ4_9FLAO|nr:single-stranded DNA-binding protein [Chryseobacterium joostei]AZA99140.1 single-stranded DNA-binding protein [Chryseobacterium joostei]SIS28200.1 single-strand DNA-binding protein [Chryseobacterium joostei]
MNIIGRLTKNAEVSKTPNGKEVVNFSIAVNDSYKNKAGQRIEQTEFVDCSYWLTPKAVTFLVKGLLVELSGRISARAWLSSDGTAKAGLNFHTSAIKPLGKPAKQENGQSTQTSAEKQNANTAIVAGSDDDDLPF